MHIAIASGDAVAGCEPEVAIAVVEDGVDGLITKAHDLDAFTCAIRRLTSDPEARTAMGRKARERVVNRSWPGAFRKFWAATLA